MLISWLLFVCSVIPISGHLTIQIKREAFEDEVNIIKRFNVLHVLGNHTYLVGETGRTASRSLVEKDPFVTVLPKRRLHVKYHPGVHKLIIAASIPVDALLEDITANLPKDHFKVIKALDSFSGEYVFLLKVEGDGIFFNETAHRLSIHPHVIWVDIFHPTKHHADFAYAIMTQSSDHIFDNYDTTFLNDPNEILTIGDTGLDFHHCAFQPQETDPLKFVYNGRNRNEIARSIPLELGQNNKVLAYIANEFFDFSGGSVRLVHTDFTDNTGGHGTHVAGIAAGNFANCPQRKNGPKQNLPSAVRLLMLDFERSKGPSNSLNTSQKTNEEEGSLLVPPLLFPLLSISYEAGSRVISNSWGSETCEYTHYSMEIDRFIYLHDDYVVLFAAGNSGPKLETVTSPGTFKNGIAIGASQTSALAFLQSSKEQWEDGINRVPSSGVVEGASPDNIAAFSSRGPTCDGRLKPDLVAPGEYILSAWAHEINHDLYLWMRGTSMACPAVARIVLICRSILRKRYNLPKPSAALVKNILITTATHQTGYSSKWYVNGLTGKYGSKIDSLKRLDVNDEGYGLVNLKPLIDDEIEFYDRLPIKSYERPHKLRYRTSQNGIISIGLVWTDPPAHIHSKKILVNDLNLFVRVSFNNKTRRLIYGNEFELPDELNNVERVRFSVLENEDIEIIIAAHGHVTVLPPNSVQHYTLALHPRQLLISIPEPNDESKNSCYLDDPPWHCTNIFVPLGEVPCLNGQYSIADCWTPCQNTSRHCNCYRHQPCGEYGKSGDLKFSHCQNGNLTTCSFQYGWTRAKHERNPGISGFLNVLSSDAQIDRGLWAIFFSISVVFTILLLLSTSYLMWRQDYHFMNSRYRRPLISYAV